ncbi:MAG: FAD-dependent monooxygenase, partial [Anaplasmataceae bacterium]|nr:FAD-dependent monooxygenase [Anaplasmataceae bacterium]
NGIIAIIALYNNGYTDIQIIEKNPNYRDIIDNRTTNLSVKSLNFFDQLDVGNEIRNNASKIMQIVVQDIDASGHIVYGDENQQEAMGYVINNNILRRILFDKLDELKIEVIIREYQSIEFAHQSSIVFDDNDTMQADLFICAEGRNSKLKKFVACDTHDYEQTCMILNVEHREEHHNIAYETFFPCGPFAILPLKNPYQSSIIWTEEAVNKDLYLSYDNNKLMTCIESRSHLKLIKILNNINHYNISLNKVKKYYYKNIVFIGDAAHAIHPVAGQGLNLGIYDTISLIHHLKKYKNRTEMLSNFNDDRIKNNAVIINTTHHIINIFKRDNCISNYIISKGFNLINKTKTIKNMLVKYATGSNIY